VGWKISPHVLNVSDEAVAFFRHVLDELTDVFPSELVHVGGDEVPTDEWAASPAAARRVVSEGLSGPDDLVGWWARQLAAHLAHLGRRSGVWDEVLEHGPPAGSVVFAWQGVERVTAALESGCDVVAAPYEHTYFDWAESDDPDEPLAIGGTLPLEKVYGYEPPPGVLGVQAQLWSEYLPTPDLVEWRGFPRLAALAEVGWSRGARDFADFRRRLGGQLRLLDALEVRYRPPTGG
jgi:hexosaminidase